MLGFKAVNKPDFGRASVPSQPQRVDTPHQHECEIPQRSLTPWFHVLVVVGGVGFIQPTAASLGGSLHQRPAGLGKLRSRPKGGSPTCHKRRSVSLFFLAGCPRFSPPANKMRLFPLASGLLPKGFSKLMRQSGNLFLQVGFFQPLIWVHFIPLENNPGWTGAQTRTGQDL